MAKIQIFIKMKKTILLLFGFMSAGMFAQSQYTVEQTEKSNDPKVVANFIVNYPTHPKTPEFKRKLARLSVSSSSSVFILRYWLLNHSAFSLLNLAPDL